MAKQQLDAAQIGSGIEQMGGEGVAQYVGAERFSDAKLLAQLLTGDAGPVCNHGPVRPPSRKKPLLGLTPAPVQTQNLQQLRRQHDLARKLALALADVDDHPLAVDIGDLQVQSFLTQTGAVVQCQQCTVLGVGRCIKQSTDFFPAPHRGQLAAHLGLDDLLIEPGLLQRPHVEELQRRSSTQNRSPGQLPLVQQVQQERTNMLWSELIG
jgi:hypothetical protein